MTISNDEPVAYESIMNHNDLDAAIAYLIVEEAAARWDDNGAEIQWWTR